ncbi:S8 family serine peptidase [Arthrobacter citreus]|nr:S8 family serine peptidase [Arthrobacter citreus]
MKHVAPFNSRGPAWLTFDIKPEITAPGVNVYSTIPFYMDGGNGNYDYSYDRYSGISMASPHVAGVVALLKAAHPNLSQLDIKSILMNTAENDIPANVENVEVEVKVPGHLSTKLQINEINDLINSKYAGSFIKLPNTMLTPGDIHGDDVIDVLDAVEIKKYLGTENRSADINFDGTVNKQDMWSVYLYYLAINDAILNAPQPKETYNGETLQDNMNELGIKF